MLAAVKQDGYALRYASDELKKDKQFVKDCVSKCWLASIYADRHLQSDQSCRAFFKEKQEEQEKTAGKGGKNTRDQTLIYYSESPTHFYNATSAAKNNKELVLAVVRKNGNMLKFASEGLRNDVDVVFAAVTKNIEAFEYASKDLKNDGTFMLKVVEKNGDALKYASKTLTSDKEFMLNAIKQNEYTFMCASDNLKKDRTFVIEALKTNPNIIVYYTDIRPNAGYSQCWGSDAYLYCFPVGDYSAIKLSLGEKREIIGSLSGSGSRKSSGESKKKGNKFFSSGNNTQLLPSSNLSGHSV